MNPLGLLLDMWSPKLLTLNKGSQWGNPNDGKVLSPNNTGVLVDGNSLALSEEDSYKGIAVVGFSGSGKTSRYIQSNICRLAEKRNASFFCCDPSQELYSRSKKMLENRGFVVRKISFGDPTGDCLNPLAECQSFAEIEDMAKTLIFSMYCDDASKSDFWKIGGVRVTTLLLSVLRLSSPDMRYFNIPNLLHLLQNWDKLDSFMEYHANDTLMNEYRSLTESYQNTISGFIISAIGALGNLNEPMIAGSLTRSDIDWQLMRERPCAYFLCVPEMKLDKMRYLSSLVASRFYTEMMRETPAEWEAARRGRKCLPVHGLLDEFANSFFMPDYPQIAAVCRRYKIANTIVIQDLAQLAKRYSENESKVMLQGGHSLQLFYPGIRAETAHYVSEMLLGEVDKKEILWNGEVNTEVGKLMTINDLRTMRADQLVAVSGNSHPFLLETTPYYKHRKFSKMLGKDGELNEEVKVIPTVERISLI